MGNPDLYGIGIRTGIYAQWLSALLANHCLSYHREDIHSAYFLFSFALAIATVVITANPSKYCVFFVEVYVLVSLFFGGYFSVHLFPVEKPASRQERCQGSGRWRSGRLVSLALVYGAMISYNCWFWFKGHVAKFQPTPCGSALFLFAKISGDNLPKAVRFYEAFSIMMAVYYPFGTFFLLRHGQRLSEWFDDMYTPYGPFISTHRRNRLRGVISSAMPFISVFCLVLAVCAIELTLLWNSVSEISSMNSVGQFIPFTVGVGGLVQVLWAIARESVSMSFLS
jgi:NADH:ubiquinone oxidoreductase subunit 6 (subunit J)